MDLHGALLEIEFMRNQLVLHPDTQAREHFLLSRGEPCSARRAGSAFDAVAMSEGAVAITASVGLLDGWSALPSTVEFRLGLSAAFLRHE